MKFYVVLDHVGSIQVIVQKEENAEAKIPSTKKQSKIQAKDRTWSYGRKDPWTIRHQSVEGDRVPGTKTSFVYAAENPLSLHFDKADGLKEIRILDADGLYVQDAE